MNHNPFRIITKVFHRSDEDALFTDCGQPLRYVPLVTPHIQFGIECIFKKVIANSHTITTLGIVFIEKRFNEFRERSSRVFLEHTLKKTMTLKQCA